MRVRPFCLPALRRLPVLGLALLAAGCSNRILVCPVPAILADTANITVMRPGTVPDLANELYTVHLIDADSDCVVNNRTAIVKSSLTLTFRATRAPTREAARYSVPYFVVATEGSKIFAKRAYTLTVEFAPGAATATIKQSPDDTAIQIENGKLPWNYQLMAGFQLTPAQIAYNKTKVRYLP
jgi:hypothetical protein